ncbi:uncharacterized protein PITG_16215 [Phytophthora infestans T30-4]|uniref:Uncharacterized protein n=1 Tax=Phytophthora infestans (strain T30-4) TaxID=403677 RepID=D0NTE4_PHYIT|nr:uncharacterized protein PITG_16215 [Phytophthora infestans T30-4]EEY64895.1 hypothetical protein PITG_16215 [Phytophthora infestans T30-4]|eukprot:XP_002897625.1 hypothetical protein PITG_16215 [Phytophthora infestans T30-4]
MAVQYGQQMIFQHVVEKLETTLRERCNANIHGVSSRDLPNEHPADVSAAAETIKLDGIVLKDHVVLVVDPLCMSFHNNATPMKIREVQREQYRIDSIFTGHLYYSFECGVVSHRLFGPRSLGSCYC